MADIDTASATRAVTMRRTLDAIAVFEAFKGAAVFAASLGLLGLLHHDLHHVARALIAHLDMNPAARYPSALLHYADVLQNANLRSLVLLAALYVTVRFAEAYGLWKDLAWAEWLGALSGAIYIPFEIMHLAHRPSLAGASVFLGNVFVVGFLTLRLWRRRSAAADR